MTTIHVHANSRDKTVWFDAIATAIAPAKTNRNSSATDPVENIGRRVELPPMLMQKLVLHHYSHDIFLTHC